MIVRAKSPGRSIAAKAAPAVLLLASLTAFADYQDGLDAYSIGDYGGAMREWQEVVASPPSEVNPAIYAEAHYAIAKLYWLGAGVEQDYRKAYDWLLRASDLDHAGAQAKLGFMYTDGLLVRQDFNKAFAWYQKAARGGNVDGLYNLGIFYFYGWGVERDPTLAAQYLATASAQGDASAEEALQQVLAQIEAERDGLTAGGRPVAEIVPSSAELAPAGGTPVIEPVEQSRTMAAWSVDQMAAAEGAAEPNPVREDAPAESDAEPSAARSESQPIPEAMVRDEAWIREQDPDHFTIQVMALGDRSKLENLLQGQEKFAPFAIYTVQKETNPLHVLLQGSYPDVASARAAQSHFPRKIQRQDKLWIRRFEMVQRLLE